MRFRFRLKRRAAPRLSEAITGAELTQVPVLGPRFRAVLTAGREFLNETFLDDASDEESENGPGQECSSVRFNHACSAANPCSRLTDGTKARSVRARSVSA